MSDKREQKQRVILEAAQKVFLSDGYISASMDTIAAEAHVTKQTVYRYFSSKEVLFQSTLKAMSQHSGEDFFDHLNNPDPKEALLGFALAFIRAHLSEQHLATIRLLIAESGKAPELASSFFPIGPNKTAQQLKIFCEQRFQMEETSHPVRMWTCMLLALRTGVLLGLAPPTDEDIEVHARKTTDFFLAAISK